MHAPMCFRAERWFHRCGVAALLVSLVACAEDNPVSPSASPVPTNPATPSPKPAPPGAPGSVKLTLSRTDVVFNAMAGAALRDSAAIAVSAASGDALSDVAATVRYGEGKPDGWLAVAFDHTTLPATMSLRATSSSLPSGDYTATVRLAAPGAAPESLSVTAHVTSGPGIGLNATKICFTPTFTGPDARPDDVRITSLDGSPIDGLTAAIIYDPGQPTDWLSTSFTAPSAPSRLWLTAHRYLVPGTYHATVQVSSTTPGVAPVSISVTLEVRPLQSSTLTLTLETVGLGGAGNGRLTATGIDCVLTNGVQGGDCEESYAPGTVVHVTVLPSAGQEFYYTQGCPFPGPCSPTGFDVTMSEVSRSSGGGFGALASMIVVGISWEGSQNDGLAFVDGPHGLLCGHGLEGGCHASLDGGVGPFPLSASYDYGAEFVRWEGACTGSGECLVRFDTPGTTKNVEAVFRTRKSYVQFQPRGAGASGSVTVSPTLTGLSGSAFVCNLVQGVAQAGCLGTLDAGAGTLTLTATPAPGSRFAGWEVTAFDQYSDTRITCAEPLSTTCVLTFVHGNTTLDGFVNFAPQ